MLRLLFTAAFVCAAALVCAADVPKILIVQDREVYKGKDDTNFAVALVMAQEFETDGRLAPVVWNLTDPTFRAAVNDGKLKTPSMEPTLDEIQSGRAALGCEYLMVVKAVWREGIVLATANFYRGGRVIWKDPETVDQNQINSLKKMLKAKRMTQEEYDLAVMKASARNFLVSSRTDVAHYDTAQSLARTWLHILTSGPIRTLTPKPKQDTPNPLQGQGTNIAAPTLDKIIDNTQVLATTAQLLKTNKSPLAAINFVRDAVDAEPLDVTRRLMLIKLLNQVKLPLLAAGEARRAAEVLPEKVTLRAAAARSWLLAGRPDEAQIDLNEAIAREPDNPDTRILMAELSLFKNDPKKALEHLDVALAKTPSADGHYKRSLALALLGNEKGSTEAMAAAIAAGLSTDPLEVTARYTESVYVVETAVAASGNDLRSLFQRAVVKRKDPEVRALLEVQAAMAKARGTFIQALGPPLANTKSHEKRVLALKLLQQSLSELRNYLEKGDEDTLADARINLGEALRGMTAAKEAFDAENKPVATDERTNKSGSDIP